MHDHSCSHMDEVETVRLLDFEALAKTVLGDTFDPIPIPVDGGLEVEQAPDVDVDMNREEQKSRRSKRYTSLTELQKVVVTLTPTFFFCYSSQKKKVGVRVTPTFYFSVPILKSLLLVNRVSTLKS